MTAAAAAARAVLPEKQHPGRLGAPCLAGKRFTRDSAFQARAARTWRRARARPATPSVDRIGNIRPRNRANWLHG
ncbi:hypothetical protein GCM10009079_22430 [Ralstonia mannitolilytica]